MHYSPNIKSYLWAIIAQRYRMLTGTNGWGNLRQIEKKEVNYRIIKATIEEAKQHGIKLIFVLFYRPEELSKDNWRSEFLKETFEKLSANYIDTKPILLHKIQQNSIAISDLFDSKHPRPNANKILAEGIADYVLGERN
jgi:hypothetical protein